MLAIAVIGAVCCLTACNINANPNVYSWGTSSPVPNDLTNAVQVSAGWGYFLALRSDGTVTGWGTNDVGQATDPYGLTNVVEVSAGPGVSAACCADGTIAVWGQVDPAVVFPDDLTNVVKVIACETNEFFVLRNTGEADAFGMYTNITLYGVTDIAGAKFTSGIGDSSLMASFTDGTIWLSNVIGIATNRIPASVFNVVAVATASGNNRVVIRDDDVAIAWNVSSGSTTTYIPMNGTNVIDITGGFPLVYALSTNGVVRSMIGVTKWPTNSPPLQTISAGYNYCGAGIIK